MKIHLFYILCVLAFTAPQLSKAQANQVYQSAPKDDIRLYPNPVKNVLNITTDAKEGTDVKIVIHALDGRLLHTSYHKTEFKKVSVDISKLNKGLYVLMLTIGNKRTGHKIIKE